MFGASKAGSEFAKAVQDSNLIRDYAFGKKKNNNDSKITIKIKVKQS